MVGEGRGGRKWRGETGNVKLVVEHLFWCGVWSQWMYYGTVYITNVESKLFLKEA